MDEAAAQALGDKLGVKGVAIEGKCGFREGMGAAAVG